MFNILFCINTNWIYPLQFAWEVTASSQNFNQDELERKSRSCRNWPGLSHMVWQREPWAWGDLAWREFFIPEDIQWRYVIADDISFWRGCSLLLNLILFLTADKFHWQERARARLASKPLSKIFHSLCCFQKWVPFFFDEQQQNPWFPIPNRS